MSCRNHLVHHYAVLSILNNSISAMLSDALSLCSSRNVTDQAPHTCKPTRKTTVRYILTSVYLMAALTQDATFDGPAVIIRHDATVHTIHTRHMPCFSIKMPQIVTETIF
jgi:hypothetical protein